jgi:uncharacterized protein
MKRKLSLSIAAILIILYLGATHYFSNILLFPAHVTFEEFEAKHADERMHPSDLALTSETIIATITPSNEVKGWYIAANPVTTNLVVLVHGRGVNKRKTLKYVPYLARAGYNILLMDNRRSGNSYEAPSSFGYYEGADLATVIKQTDLLTKQEQIVFMGYSLGAAASVVAATKLPSVKGFVLDSPYRSIRSIVNERAKKSYTFLPQFFIDLVIIYTEHRLGFEFDEVNLEKLLAKLGLPVFLIHGLSDTSIDVSNSEKLHKSRSDNKTTLWLVPDTGHVDAFLIDNQNYKKKTLHFLNKIFSD